MISKAYNLLGLWYKAQSYNRVWDTRVLMVMQRQSYKKHKDADNFTATLVS
jgi:hypothetical protein